jgi:hypothetical protein
MMPLLQHTLLSLGGKVMDGHISLLINAGLLVSKLGFVIIDCMLLPFEFKD